MAIGNPITLTSNVASKTISVIATAGQTLFTVTGGYRINQLAVFRNGVRLLDGRDYDARDGSTVTLLSAATVGDSLEFQVFDDFRVADAIVSAESEQTIQGSLTISGGMTVAGLLTATDIDLTDVSLRHLRATGISTFSDTTQSTSTTTGALIVSGGAGIAKDLFVGGDMSVAGTLSYEDVTNVETSGITTTGGLVVTGLGATFGSISTHFSNIEFGAAGVGGTITPLGHAGFTGIVTALGFQASGVITATSFRGDGSELSGVDSSNLIDSGSTNRVAANTSGIVVTGIATVTGDVSIADKIIHTGDTNTAIRFPAADTFTVETAGSERLRIDSNGLIANNARVPSSYGSPNLLVSGTDSTLTLMGDGSSNNSSFTGIKFRVAGASSGDYTKAGIFAQRQGGYNDLDLIFSLDTAADASSVAISDEKLRITSAGIVTVASGGSLAIPAVPGTNTNANMSVLFQSTTGLVDGGSGLLYNPSEDALKVNGNNITASVFRGAGDDATLCAANSSSTSFFMIDAGSPKIQMAADKVIAFSGSIGEIGSVTGFQATTTDASSNTDFGIRATTIRFATGSSERIRIGASGQIGIAGANFGTSGQVLTSGGASGTVTWEDASSGISTQAGTASGIVTSMFLTDATDHKVTATGICTITTTQAGTEGQSHTIRIVNSGIATVGFSTYFLFPSGAAPSLPTADGAVSLISFTVHDSVGAGCTQLLAGASVNFS